MTDYRTEVERLQNEIVKLKTDKDFVWALWKRLQLSSPDLIEAVSLITKREKDKIAAELFDLKETIREKDQTLADLHQAIDVKNNELAALAMSNEETLARALALEKHCAELTNHASKLDHVLDGLEERDGHMAIVNEYERERRALTEKVSRLQAQLTSTLEDKANLQLLAVKNERENRFEDQVDGLVLQLEEARKHIETQQDTIGVLRDQLERTAFRARKSDNHGYSSDGDAIGRSGRPWLEQDCATGAGDEPRLDSPIEDLNYKVDRLQLHMQQLQDCLPRRPQRSKSSPARPKSSMVSASSELAQCQKRLHLISTRLARTEKSLSEEKASGVAGQQLLDKANTRSKSLLANVKQLRAQIEQARALETEMRRSQELLENELDSCKRQLHGKQIELDKAGQDSLKDAARIRDLLASLEAARTDLTIQNIRRTEETDKEMDRLKDLVRQLENDKCALEMRCNNTEKSLASSLLSRQYQILPVSKEKKYHGKLSKKRRSRLDSRSGRAHLSIAALKMSSILDHFVGKDNKPCDAAAAEEEEHEHGEDEEHDDIDNYRQCRLWGEANRTTGSRLGGSEDDIIEELLPTPEADIDRQEDTVSEQSWTSRCSVTPITSPVTTGSRALPPTKANCTARMRRMATAAQEARAERARRLERDLRVVKQRVSSLRQQLRNAVESRASLKVQNVASQTQLRQSQADLAQAKARCSRLEESLKGISGDSGGVGGLDRCRELQHDLRAALQELEKTRDKASRLDRDSSCKKRVIDDLRSRLASIDDTREKERLDGEQSRRRAKELEDNNLRLRTQTESLQTRVTALLDERRRSGHESAQLLGRLESAEQRLVELRLSKQAAEKRLTAMGERHDCRVSEIVSCSDSALEQAALQIHELQARTRRYDRLVVSLATEFHRKVREIHRLLEFGHGKLLSNCESKDQSKSESARTSEESPGIEFARSKAADILNMSACEIDSLLLSGRSPLPSGDAHKQLNTNHPAVGNSGVQCKKQGPPFVQRIRHILQHEAAFEQAIQQLFLDQLEQLVDMVAPVSGCDSGCVSLS